MSLLSHDLTQSWSSSSEQVLTVPENKFLRKNTEGSERHLQLLSQNDMLLKSKETQVSQKIPIKIEQRIQHTSRTQFTHHLSLLSTYCVPGAMHLRSFVYLNPAISLNLRESSFLSQQGQILLLYMLVIQCISPSQLLPCWILPLFMSFFE